MSINSIANQYFQYSQSQGVQGDGGSFQVNYSDDVLTFTEADGDTYKIDASDLKSADIEMLSSVLGVDVANETKEADGVSDSSDLQEEAEAKEQEIEKTSDEIKNIFDETLEEQEKITKEEYLRILDVVNGSVASFMEARQNGEEVDINALNSEIMAGVNDSTYEQDIEEAFSGLEGANSKIQEMSTLLQEYGSIAEQMTALDNQRMTELQGMSEEAAGGLSGEDYAILQGVGQGFMANNFFENYNEKLDGHKEQYSSISDFRELDDGIIQMYTEYAQSAATTVQSMLNEENKTETPADTKEAEETKETDKADIKEVKDEDKDKEEA